MSEASLNDRQFFGHPIGLRTLFLTEMWERMSYYGMRALLVLYMTGAVTGFNPGLGWSQLDAQAIYGVYVGLVYFMVVPGGWLADNILGHQRAVLYGAIIIALGPYSGGAVKPDVFSGSGFGGTWHRSAQGQHFHNCRQTLPG